MKTNEKNVISLAKKLRMALAELGSNQTEIAKKMGISKAQISHWIAGDNKPSMESLTKLADAVGKPVNYFFENSGNIADNNSTISVAERSSNYEIAMLQKDMEIVKKEIEILKMKMENKK